MTQLASLADAPNTLREYETIYVLRPDTVNDKVAEVNGRVRTIIESMGGKVLNVDNWGKRKLAYEIRKQLKGIYLYWQYLAAPEVVAEFERNMRMLDSVIRYMTVQTAVDVDPGGRDSTISDESYEKAATTAADEEELMLGRGGSAEAADSEDFDDDYEAGDDSDDDDEPSETASAARKVKKDEEE